MAEVLTAAEVVLPPTTEILVRLTVDILAFARIVEVEIREGLPFRVWPLESWKLLLSPNFARIFPTRVANFNLKSIQILNVATKKEVPAKKD